MACCMMTSCAFRKPKATVKKSIVNDVMYTAALFFRPAKT